MKKSVLLGKSIFAASLMIFASFSVSAYEIKVQYENVLLGNCDVVANPEIFDFEITENADGSWSYDGPAGKGKVKKGSDDAAARKACGEEESKKAKKKA